MEEKILSNLVYTPSHDDETIRTLAPAVQVRTPSSNGPIWTSYSGAAKS